MSFWVVCRGRPATPAGIGRTIYGGLTDMRHRRLVDRFLAGLRVDRFNDVLWNGLLAPEPLAVAAVERLDDANLAALLKGKNIQVTHE